MKITAFAALMALAAAPAVAQEQEPAPAEAPVKKFTIDNSIEELMANEATAAILLKHIPGINEHPAYDQFKGMSLVELQPWSAGAVTDAIIAAVTKDLAELG